MRTVQLSFLIILHAMGKYDELMKKEKRMHFQIFRDRVQNLSLRHHIAICDLSLLKELI
jgi:hypothetical protein